MQLFYNFIILFFLLLNLNKGHILHLIGIFPKFLFICGYLYHLFFFLSTFRWRDYIFSYRVSPQSRYCWLHPHGCHFTCVSFLCIVCKLLDEVSGIIFFYTKLLHRWYATLRGTRCLVVFIFVMLVAIDDHCYTCYLQESTGISHHLNYSLGALGDLSVVKYSLFISYDIIFVL